jgi:uncharacterized metal-binding protein
MASGATHNNVALLSGAAVSLLSFPFFPAATVTRFAAGVLWSTYYESSDLDCKSSVYYRWGPLKFIWKPFISSGHREILHNPFWGPFVLISFAWFVSLAAAWVYFQDFSFFPVFVSWFKDFALGMLFSIWLHILVDKVT